ncbi:meiosis-specific with OB domain-containing protein [Diachasma alloeum]|uniref:meiosis-specific with OB domain-containing protein n=1 Tax=Diachasma alloeum TaxID=454923 RepID=UPI00073849CB|nr:meiosis-specific with OB domain-containing protein [Diachasma alloeum]
MTSVYHQKINALQLNIQNSLVVGVIITSSNVKTFEVNSKYRPGRRAVWTFTLRDSENDTINITVWGSETYVSKLHESFPIGCVVEVINAKVQDYPTDGKNERFMPTTSSRHHLVVNEGAALIQLHDSPNKELYEALLHVPMKNVSKARSLSDILKNMEGLQDQYVDVLAAVTFVSDSRNLMTKDGRALVCRDFEVNDGTTNNGVAFKLWENEWIRRSANWEPKHSVLFMSDLLVTMDKFKKKMTLMIVRKTVITEDPDVPQADKVRNSISQTDMDSISHDPFILPKPENIKTVMTIKEISEKLNKKQPTGGDRIQFVAILYATVTEINMENAQGSDILITRCALCKRTVPDTQDSCMNLECPCGNGRRAPTNVHNFYLRVNLKDETGYLIGCRLTGAPAEQALACSVDEFKAMTQTQREELKWRLILENCDVRLQVLGPTPTFPRVLYNILSLERTREVKDQ